MRTYISLLAIFALTLGLSSCGGQKNPEPIVSPKVTQPEQKPEPRIEPPAKVEVTGAEGKRDETRAAMPALPASSGSEEEMTLTTPEQPSQN